MMKFKNTLIIFLGIIAIIFVGCKEKKATHESGIIAEPQKSETYEENGISYKKEKYLSYEITYPVLNKNIKDNLDKGKMKKAEKITIKVLKVVERIARNEVEKTVLGRTAECSAIYHQPKRPKKREN